MLLPQLASISLVLPAIVTIAQAVSIPVSVPSTSSIKWKPEGPQLDYGELQVPIDWNNTHGEKVTLGLLRWNATNQANKVGSLLFNPGGPGIAASSYVAEANYTFGSGAYENFDIIALDPRGVGLSSPIKCDADIYNERVTHFPSTKAELAALVSKNKRFAESCLNMTGPLVKFMDSVSVARDIEAIRLALGGEKLNYLGLSYGTLIGQAYAELYPHNIRSMVLDGNIDHSTSQISWLNVQSSATEVELVRWAEWCQHNSTCALNGTNVLKTWDDLIQKANEEPIPAPGCKVSGTCRENVTGEELQLNLNDWLFFKNGPTWLLEEYSWAGLGVALAQAKAGNATLLSSSLATSNSSTSFESAVIHCLDWAHPKASLEEIAYRKELTSALSPHTASSADYFSGCMGWPIAQTYKEHYAHIHGTPNILQINAQYDPSCSYVWANGLHEQISNSTLLTRRGDGHISYWLMGDSTNVIDSYFVNLTAPAPNSYTDS